MIMIASLVSFDRESQDRYEKLIDNTINIINKDEVEEEQLAELEVLICRDRDLSEEFVLRCKKLKLIYVVSAGVEKLPFKVIRQKGILVANAAGICDDAISDYVLGVMLAFSSKIYDCILYKENSYWKPYLYTDTLRGKTLTIVGTGKIGKAICHKAKVFGMNVIGVRRSKKLEKEFDGIETFHNLNEVLSYSDYIVSTVPLTDETYHLFNRDMFLSMKETAVFINISRGGVVDENALIRALNEKKIFGAALDVFEKEPLPKDNPLWDIGNLIISPHSSGRLCDFMDYAMDIFATNYNDYKNNRTLTNQVNVELGY